MTTYNTYPDLLIDGGRLAATDWPGATAAEAVAATLRLDDEAIVLRVSNDRGERIVGHAPGGLA